MTKDDLDQAIADMKTADSAAVTRINQRISDLEQKLQNAGTPVDYSSEVADIRAGIAALAGLAPDPTTQATI